MGLQQDASECRLTEADEITHGDHPRLLLASAFPSTDPGKLPTNRLLASVVENLFWAITSGLPVIRPESNVGRRLRDARGRVLNLTSCAPAVSTRSSISLAPQLQEAATASERKTQSKADLAWWIGPSERQRRSRAGR